MMQTTFSLDHAWLNVPDSEKTDRAPALHAPSVRHARPESAARYLPFSSRSRTSFALIHTPRHRTAITRNRDILPSPQHPHARSLSTLQLGPSVPAPSGWAGGASAGWPRASMQATPNLGSPGAARQEACVLSSVGTGVALPLRIGAVVICWQVGARIGHITAVPFKVGIGAGVRT